MKDMGAWGVVGFALLGSSCERRESHMGDTTSFTLDQADEEILTYTVSDETLEATAGTERAAVSTNPVSAIAMPVPCC